MICAAHSRGRVLMVPGWPLQGAPSIDQDYFAVISPYYLLVNQCFSARLCHIANGLVMSPGSVNVSGKASVARGHQPRGSAAESCFPSLHMSDMDIGTASQASTEFHVFIALYM